MNDSMDVRYHYEILVDGECQAGGDAATQAEAEREAMRYYAQYSQDGNCIVLIERCEMVACLGGITQQEESNA